MKWDRDWLERNGFQGFVTFAELPGAQVPSGAGVYMVYRTSLGDPGFLAESCGGHFKRRNPTVPVEVLRAKWVPDAHVLNFGKAAAGTSGRRGLRKRLDEYRRFGAGEPIGHAGGRYIWQLSDSADLLVGWLATPDRDPRQVEREWIADFVRDFGARPFANLTD